jgi:asparagine synthase (glutamine-hydrolysing)
LRKAFDDEFDQVVPREVLFRSKAAFSDAVSTFDQSWHMIIKKHIDGLVTDTEFESERLKYAHCTPETKEAYYYRKTYHKYYNSELVIPHFWLPRWCGDQKDPSARELGNEVYAE